MQPHFGGTGLHDGVLDVTVSIFCYEPRREPVDASEVVVGSLEIGIDEDRDVTFDLGLERHDVLHYPQQVRRNIGGGAAVQLTYNGGENVPEMGLLPDAFGDQLEVLGQNLAYGCGRSIEDGADPFQGRPSARSIDTR